MKLIWQNKSFMGGFLLGIGIIGMLDGIVFHQILQWHSVYMHTDRKHQIVSDGLFHLLVTGFTLWGGIVLWQSDPAVEGRSRKRLFAGGLFIGAGIFNFLEGIVNHHILQIHHVIFGPNQLLSDILYDISGLAMIAAGYFLVKPRLLQRIK